MRVKKNKEHELSSWKSIKCVNKNKLIINIEIMALIGDTNLNQDWCMDSGASDHMCHDKKV